MHYLEVDDEFKRTLGFLPDDESFDVQSQQRAISALRASETYVQGAVGENDNFYQQDGVQELYKLACYAIAANWYNHPSSAVSSTTARMIIGQLRGKYDESGAGQDGSTSKSGQTKS